MARLLHDMDLSVIKPNRNPVWSRDELLLALDLYMRHRPLFPDDKHSDVVALSRPLNSLSTTTKDNKNFRNPNGVAMKLQNFRRFDPDQEGKGLPGGGKGEADVWATFATDVPLYARLQLPLQRRYSFLTKVQNWS